MRTGRENSTPAWIPIWAVSTKDPGNIVPISNYYTDVNNESTFPQVVFIEESGSMDEHPKPNPGAAGSTASIQGGAALTAKIVNALMDRAELSTNLKGSDFSQFQTTIMLEEQVSRRTAELSALALGIILILLSTTVSAISLSFGRAWMQR